MSCQGLNDKIGKFSKTIESQAVTEKSGSDRDMAKYLIGFMVRHIFSNLQYAFDHSASEGFDCDQIFPFALEAIQILEYIVLYVGVIAGDGALSNGKYFNYKTRKM